MYLAICADTGMLFGILIFFVVAGAAVSASFVLVVSAIVKWVNVRQKRLAAES